MSVADSTDHRLCRALWCCVLCVSCRWFRAGLAVSDILCVLCVEGYGFVVFIECAFCAEVAELVGVFLEFCIEDAEVVF